MTYTPLQMAAAFIRSGELNDALDALNTHLNTAPDDDQARRTRIAVLLRMPGEAYQSAALDDLKALADLTAEDAVQRSIVLQRLGDWLGANAAMEAARTLSPDDERITERYVMTLEMSGQLETARRLLTTLPKTWRWLQTAGDLAARAGEPQAAVEYYRAALEHLETRMDTVNNPIAANLKAVLMLKQQALEPS